MTTTALLRERGIRPSAQRVAVGDYVLFTDEHPSAEQVWRRVRRRSPISRATVYNCLNLFVEKGLLRPYELGEGHIVFDPNVGRHHHLLDEATGRVHDVPWNAVRVSRVRPLGDWDVRGYEIVLRGTRRRGAGRKRR